MIKVLFEGLHQNHFYEGFYEIDPLTSSSILIRKDGVNVLVDTGLPKYKDLLIEKLAENGLNPSDIHYVCNTHFHLDHCANDVLFTNAEVFVGLAKLDYKTGKAVIYRKKELMNLPCGIVLLQTPGHTSDHVSFLYEEDGIKYVCAGDAVREDLIRRQYVPHLHAAESFVPSMRLIFESADVIIPGHGRVLEGELKKELYELVCGEWRMAG